MLDSVLNWIVEISQHPITKVIGILFAIITIIVNSMLVGIVRWLKGSLAKKKTLLDAKEKKLKKLQKALEDAEGRIWHTYDAQNPPEIIQRLVPKEPLIITIANLKGGVGKTSLVSNLLAYFNQASHRTPRVLVIDLDYQGSLSTTMYNLAGLAEKDPYKSAANLFSEKACATTTFNNMISLGSKFPGCSFIPTFYEFQNVENKLMVQWLLQDFEGDLRYQLASCLLNDEVKAQFDIILIDTPPRLTTGTVNALCCSTHFIIPTVLDSLAAEAVGTFTNMVQKNIKPLNPSLELLGVVGQITQQEPGLMGWEIRAKEKINEEMPWNPHRSVFNRHIPRKAAFARVAGEELAYFQPAEGNARPVKDIFDELGTEIEDRIWGIVDGGQN